MSTPRFEFSRFDRITIDGTFYQPIGQTDDTVRFQRLDRTDVCEDFSYDQIEKLRKRSGWRHEKGWFAESAAPIEADKVPETMASALTVEEQEKLAWLRMVFGAIDELHEYSGLSLSHESFAANRLTLTALVNQRDIERKNLKVKPRGGAKVEVHMLPSDFMQNERKLRTQTSRRPAVENCRETRRSSWHQRNMRLERRAA